MHKGVLTSTGDSVVTHVRNMDRQRVSESHMYNHDLYYNVSEP